MEDTHYTQGIFQIFTIKQIKVVIHSAPEDILPLKTFYIEIHPIGLHPEAIGPTRDNFKHTFEQLYGAECSVSFDFDPGFYNE